MAYTLTEGTLYSSTSVLTSVNLRALVSSAVIAGLEQSEIGSGFEFVHVKTSAPTTSNGRPWVDTSNNNNFKIYNTNDSAWHAVGFGIGSTMPTNPQAKDAFWDTTTKTLSVNDGSLTDPGHYPGWVNIIDGHVFADAAMWGLVDDDATVDQTDLLQECIYDLARWAESGGSWSGADDTIAMTHLMIRPGRYKIDKSTSVTAIVIPRGIMVEGSGLSAITTDEKGVLATSDGITQFVWGGGAGGNMFELSSRDQTKMLFGGGIKNIALFGSEGATPPAVGILSINTHGVVIEDIYLDQVGSGSGLGVLDAGIAIWAENGLSSSGACVRNIRGYTGAGANGRCMVLVGNYYPVTPADTDRHNKWHKIENVYGHMYNGYAVRLWRDATQCTVAHIHAVKASGAGGAVVFEDSGDIDKPSPRGNVAMNISGNILAQENTVNTLMNHTEGNVVVQSAGDPVNNYHGLLHYHTTDITDGYQFQTRKYPMEHRLYLAATGMQSLGLGIGRSEDAAVYSAGTFPGITMRLSLDSELGQMLPMADMADGTITKIIIHFCSGDGIVLGYDAKTIVWQIKVSSLEDAESVASAQYESTTNSENFTYEALSANDAYFQHEIELSSPQTYKRDDLVAVSVKRHGTHASDNSGNLQLLGLEVFYESSGPAGDGYSTFSVNTPYKELDEAP